MYQANFILVSGFNILDIAKNCHKYFMKCKQIFEYFVIIYIYSYFVINTTPMILLFLLDDFMHEQK